MHANVSFHLHPPNKAIRSLRLKRRIDIMFIMYYNIIINSDVHAFARQKLVMHRPRSVLFLAFIFIPMFVSIPMQALYILYVFAEYKHSFLHSAYMSVCIMYMCVRVREFVCVFVYLCACVCLCLFMYMNSVHCASSARKINALLHVQKMQFYIGPAPADGRGGKLYDMKNRQNPMFNAQRWKKVGAWISAWNYKLKISWGTRSPTFL